MNMLQLFRPGDVIHGYCNGFFGRDDYSTKTCISVQPMYALFEYDNGRATVLNYEERLDAAITEKWKRTPDDQEV